MLRKGIVLRACAVLATAWPLVLAAQSFDCSRAVSASEKLICSNPELAAADKQLATTYNSALSQLSTEGKRRLGESQRSWIKYDRDQPPVDATSMMAAYRRRTEQLRKALFNAGPFRIQSLTLYSSSPAKPDASSSDDPGPGSTDITFPRIEDPATPEVRRCNQLIEQYAESLVDRAAESADEKSQISVHKPGVVGTVPGLDVSVDFSLAYASADLMSLALHTMTYAKGAAHPNREMEGYTVLVKSGRPLGASDLFDDQRQWKPALGRMVLSGLRSDSKRDGWDLQVTDANQLIADSADTRRWTISKRGLVVTFSPYEVSSYVTGPHEVTISWEALKPYLKTPSPFPIPLP